MKILCVLSRYAYGNPDRGENYDYVHFVPAFKRLGHEVDFLDSGDRSLHSDFADLNISLLRRVAEFQPDIIFLVPMHFEIWLETLDLIRARSPARIVSWGTDDSWKFRQVSRFFVPHVDLHVTTDPAAEEAARRSGMQNVFLSQWAASDDALAEPRPARECRYDISFVGTMYGYRAEWIAMLRKAGIDVQCFGHGTEHGVVDARDVPRIFRDSRIVLNFSGSGQAAQGPNFMSGRQIKARNFEVSGAGGFLLTETAAGLDRYYRLGDEIATFSTPAEMIARARHFLDHPEERDAITRAGYLRTRTEHTYARRFTAILDRLEPAKEGRAWTLSEGALDLLAKRHRDLRWISWVRSLLVAALVPVFGGRRGPRAARRLLYEVFWRIKGAATFSAGGWPGRLFYSES
ncbi:MAG: glycosyltransferase [Rhizobiales bacterium]|nr:glycosyltransferase [Hyphomicrobiales bacterium]